MRIELENPAGAWVELRDPESITNKERFEFDKRTRPRVVDAVVRSTGVDPKDVGAFESGSLLAEQITDQMVTAWSFNLPLPSVDPAVWYADGFPYDQIDVVWNACRPHVEKLLGTNFEPVKAEDGSVDRETPTETSAA